MDDTNYHISEMYDVNGEMKLPCCIFKVVPIGVIFICKMASFCFYL